MSQGESLSVRSHFCLAQLRASVGPVPVVAVASLGGFGGLAGSRLGACRGLSVPALRGADYYAILGIPKNADQAFLPEPLTLQSLVTKSSWRIHRVHILASSSEE